MTDKSEQNDDLTSEQLEGVIQDDPGADTVREALTDAMAESTAQEDQDADTQDGEDNQDASKDAARDEEKAKKDKDDAEDGTAESAKDKPGDGDPDKDLDKTDHGEVKGEEGAETQPLTPPGTWSAEERAEFTNLPNTVQQVILRREGDRDRAFQQKTAEINQVKERYASIDRVLEPHRESFALHGVDMATQIEQYFAIDAALSSDPAGTLKYLADRAGVDLSSINEVGPDLDPQFTAVMERLDAFDQRFNQFDSNRTNDQEAAANQRVQEAKENLDAFETATDASGNLQYPHFQDLRQSMSALILSGGAESLEDAYEQALWANPTHREAMQGQTMRDAERKAEAKRKEHAEKAKEAGVGIKGSPGGAEPPGEVGTVREELMKAGAGELATS